ncbi:VOC family protein [Aliiglaciecola sp. M165]|uniref:VOC family protein n=1 Tax=Aliiglaciecola sp. M165 TaxID=2593649 RepID=UPI00117D988F|nr:VOC family protein [Aliiglaciecola sp. M165]TRY33049.1 VOC family protein [Aliiglaciecola sp. M165]
MNPIGWFEIYVEDMPRAKAFYEQMLDITLDKIPSPQVQMWAFPSNDENRQGFGALVCVEGYKPEGNGTLIYFSCDDCALEASRVEAAGGTLQRPKMQIGEYGFVALVIDTEGNMIGLRSPK